VSNLLSLILMECLNIGEAIIPSTKNAICHGQCSSRHQGFRIGKFLWIDDHPSGYSRVYHPTLDSAFGGYTWAHMGPVFRHTHRKNQPGKVERFSFGRRWQRWHLNPQLGEITPWSQSVYIYCYTVVCTYTEKGQLQRKQLLIMTMCSHAYNIYIYWKGLNVGSPMFIATCTFSVLKPKVPWPSATKSRQCRCTRHICGHACSNNRNYAAMMCNAQEVRPHSKETWG